MENFLNHRILSLLRCCMLKIVFFLTLCLISDATFCQNTDQNKVTQIRQQMAKIRQTTNWDNPAEAKAANEQIKVLMGQLVAATSASSSGQVPAGGQNQDGSGNSNSDGNKMSELQMEMSKHKVDVYTQLWEAGASGKSAPVLLAKPLREEIVAEFKEDEAGSAANELTLEETKTLCLDMSTKTIELIIDQMQNYKSISTLIIVGGKNGSPVNLNDLFDRAKNYPLEVLYVINFKQYVKSIPETIVNFKKLTELGLFNNSIEKLPLAIGSLTSLKNLYLDINPISTITPVINTLTSLDTLGVAKTKIVEVELDKIKKSLPNCIILKQ